MLARIKSRVVSGPQASPRCVCSCPVIVEPLEARALLSASPLQLPSHYSGDISFGGMSVPTTVVLSKQVGHNVYGEVIQSAGAKSYFRGFLDNNHNLYFVFSGLNFAGHGFGHAVVSAGGKSFSGSEITYQPNGAFPSTITVTATAAT